MEKRDLPFLSTAELSELIRQKEVSPVDLTESYLERIDAVNFKFNSYLTVCRKEALQAAQQAEQAIVQGNYLGPMHGIPVAVKDQLWTKGIRTTVGSRFMADFFPEEDATAVANLKKAGAIILGKPTLPSSPLADPSATAPIAIPGTWTGSPAGPALVPGPRPPPSCAPRPWERTPGVPLGGQPPGAVWWACGPVGVGSVAMGSCPVLGLWTKSARFPARWRTPRSPWRP